MQVSTARPVRPALSRCHARDSRSRTLMTAMVARGARRLARAAGAVPNGERRSPSQAGTPAATFVRTVGGSFTVQVAQKKPGQNKWKVVHSGPTLHYVADNQAGGCGGPSFDNYQIQSFPVNFTVHKGDYIAVKAKSIGFIHSSSSGPTLLFDPALAPGGSYVRPDSAANDMLIQFQY